MSSPQWSMLVVVQRFDLPCGNARRSTVPTTKRSIMQLNSSISAVITGGASGLGRATAELLASHGVKVAIFDLQEELGEALAAEIGGVFCKVNVTSTAEV